MLCAPASDAAEVCGVAVVRGAMLLAKHVHACATAAHIMCRPRSQLSTGPT